jgi:biopolymer transport protein ExbD
VNFTTETDEDVGFQLAPLLDIVFLLLVFYIVTTAFQQQEMEQEIELPTAHDSVQRERAPLEIVVNVSRDGELIVNGVPRSLAELRVQLKLLSKTFATNPPAVTIRADRKTYHENVVHVLDACVAANMRNVSFITVEKEAS